jgi:pre-mRNA-splicing factor SYF1
MFLAIYLLYARLEEEHGLARHAMEIYDRATQAVQPEDKYEVWSL